MLTENKFSKYLIYAIGEIFLVVIGILIALQINNWNEQQNIENNQEKYLLLLKEEALKNQNSIIKTKALVEATMKAQMEIIQLKKGNIDTLSEKYLAQLFSKVFVWRPTVLYENNVLSELKSTGQLKNIKNDEIRKFLVELEVRYDIAKNQENNIFDNFKDANLMITKKGDRWRMFLADSYDEQTFKEDYSNLNLIKDQEFYNHLVEYWGNSYSITHNFYPDLEEYLKNLVTLIDNELEKTK